MVIIRGDVHVITRASHHARGFFSHGEESVMLPDPNDASVTRPRGCLAPRMGAASGEIGDQERSQGRRCAGQVCKEISVAQPSRPAMQGKMEGFDGSFHPGN
jgi:hypothetical protein